MTGMGTRADFYEGRGVNAEWLGSIAWDGYPEGIDNDLLIVTQPDTFRMAVHEFITSREDGTKPEQGWPWPWNDSGTTDFAYALDEGKVWASCFGGPWVPATEWDGDTYPDEKGAMFPDMTDKQNVTMGKRSGITLIGPQGVVKGEE